MIYGDNIGSLTTNGQEVIRPKKVKQEAFHLYHYSHLFINNYPPFLLHLNTSCEIWAFNIVVLLNGTFGSSIM
jgi:hypothetical protein